MNNTKEQVEKILDILEEKSKIYGNVDKKIETIMATMFPEGLKPHQYNDALNVMRMMEKMLRFTNDSIDKKSKLDAYEDLAGYSILGVVKYKKIMNND